MLALAEYRATRCPHCGNDLRECTSEEGTHRWRVRKRRCQATDALLLAQEDTDTPRLGAVLWRAEKVG